MKDYQKALDNIKIEEEKLLKEIKRKGGKIIDGKIVFDDDLYVVEIQTYQRTKYESYGYTEIHRNLEILPEQLVNKVLDIKSIEDESDRSAALYDFLFDDLFDKYTSILGDCVEQMEEDNTTIYLDEENRYKHNSKCREFLVEYFSEGDNDPYDAYFSLYKTSISTYKEFENVNLEMKKVFN